MTVRPILLVALLLAAPLAPTLVLPTAWQLVPQAAAQGAGGGPGDDGTGAGTPVDPSLTSPSTADPSVTASGAPWWGPGDAADAGVGWHFRVPIVLTNPHAFTITDAPTLVELDLGRLLVDAGWNGRTLGATAFPTSFTLDPDSIRVVRYTTGFADIQDDRPVPSRFYEGRFSVGAAAPFDASRNPAGTVVFTLDGTVQPGTSRFYMVYLASEEQGGRDGAAAPALVDGWAARGWGTVAYAYQQRLQSGADNRIDIVAREPQTEVTVFRYQGGRPQLADLNRPNPFMLGPPGTGGASSPATLSLAAGDFIKVLADKPILVTGRGVFKGAETGYGGGAFVHATTGNFLGNTFIVPAYAPRAYVTTGGLGAATVTVANADGSTAATLELSSARPSGELTLPVVQSTTQTNVRTLTSSGVPVMVQYAGQLVGTHVVPSRTGGVGGLDHLIASPPATILRLRPDAPTDLRVMDASKPQNQLFPFGPVDRTKAASLPAYPPTTVVGANESYPTGNPVRVLAVDTDDAPAAPVLVAAGQGEAAGPSWPDGALTTVIKGPAAVVGVFDGTRVQITQRLATGDTHQATETVNRDGVILVQPEPNAVAAEAEVHLTKPAAVLPTVARDDYARVFPAFGAGPTATVGGLDFRGALVRLSVADAVGGQAVRTVGPGQATTFELEVENVGHWTGGEPITEDVRLVCDDAPAGWTVSGCGAQFALSTGQTRTLQVTVQPGDVPPGSRLLMTVQAVGARWNTTDEGQIALLVREAFGVDAWFFAEGGPKDLTDAPFFVDKGETMRIPFIVKNTGTVEDGYELKLFPPPDGWSLDILRDETPVTSVTLGPGETTQLAFEVRASPNPPSPASRINLEVVSLANELAFATLRGDAQVQTILDVRIRSPDPVALLDPGKLHSYPIEVANLGESVVTVSLNASAALPPGWRLAVPVPEVNVFPGDATELNVTLRAPEGTAAGERGTVRLVGAAQRAPEDPPTEAVIVLTGLVRHIHDLGFPTEPVPVRPGPATELNLPLVNNGNGPEDVILLGVEPAWDFRTPGPLVLDPGETGTLAIELDIPPTTPPGRTNVTLHISLTRQEALNVTLPLDIERAPRLDVNLHDPRPLMPGKPVTLVTELTAGGNVPLAGELTVRVPDGWTMEVEPSTVALDPGATQAATFTLTAPGDVRDGTQDLRFAVEPETGVPTESAPRSLPVGRPDLALFGVELGSLDGGGLLVSARVANNGTVAARDVEVALVRDGETLAQAMVGRIAPGADAIVRLATEATGDPSGVTLVADPDERLADPDRSNNVATLEGRGLPWPGLVPGLIILTLVAALFGRAGRHLHPGHPSHPEHAGHPRQPGGDRP